MKGKNTGEDMLKLARDMWPITRSITGEGVRESLRILQQKIPIKIKSIRTGKKCYDWKVPSEWNIKSAYIENEMGERIIDFKKNNLHVVGYSIAINKWVTRKELEKNIHFIKEMPNAIPYVTSYYEKNWGFCISYNEYLNLKEERYKVVIESKHSKGWLNYGEITIKGKKKEEVFISTYICHPSMANNELSGPIIATYVAKELMKKRTRYTYRIAIVPETIGAIAYIYKNLRNLKKRVKAGFVLTCIGDNGPYSYLESRHGTNATDKVVKYVLKNYYPEKSIRMWPWTTRGSDERQYCAPGVDLPICSIMRTKYHTYNEYHTSEDNLKLFSEQSLQDSLEYVMKIIKIIEINIRPKAVHKCEAMLGKRKLYENISKKGSSEESQTMLDILSYSDGTMDVIDISTKLNINAEHVNKIVKILEKNKLIRIT